VKIGGKKDKLLTSGGRRKRSAIGMDLAGKFAWRREIKEWRYFLGE
jgi:hypothetical protein